MKKLISFFIISILVLSLTACGNNSNDPEIAYQGPIENWTAVALPEDSTWNKTVFSGSVENHSYNVNMSKSDFFAFLEMAMEANGWTLSNSIQAGRYFTSEAGDLVSYTTNQIEAPLTVMVIIEPAGAYEEKSVTEEPTSEE